MTNQAFSNAPKRTWFTNMVGVAAVLLGGIGSLFSAFALLLAIGKPYANSAADPLGIFMIFILPPGTLLAGIGLLLRHRWARWWMILLMAGLVALGVKSLLAPDPMNSAYESMPGPASDAARPFTHVLSIACIATGCFVLSGLSSQTVRHEFEAHSASSPSIYPGLPNLKIQDESAGWRVGHRGRDLMFYEEFNGGSWQRIHIDGEMLTGRAHHVIYFANVEIWNRYPEWARNRRDEIISRIKSRFCEPEYEYHEGGTARQPMAAHSTAVRPPPSKNDGTILPMLLFMLVIAAGSFWLAAAGVKKGETRLPMKHNASSSSVSLNEEPVLFWASISLLSAVGTGCTTFSACLVISRLRRQ